ncbi:SGNH/GDSL hydrolase family protein [bacterium]|nr:SGNH/GDSL hydrolase family protein [bacterium]
MHLFRSLLFFLLLSFHVDFAQVDHWVFLGASITRAAIGDGKKLERLIESELGVQVKISNEAVNGMTSWELRKKLPEILKKYPEVKYFPIHIGGNDVSSKRPYPGGSKYLKENLRIILNLLKEDGRTPILFRLTFRNYKNIRNSKNYNLGSKPYVDNIFDPLIEQFSPMVNGKKLVVDAYGFIFSQKTYLSKDGVHFTDNGYKRFLKEFLMPNLFAKFYPSDEFEILVEQESKINQ